MRLSEATSRDTAGAPLVLVPVGSLEQHGPHLPLDTDTVIATAVATAVAAKVGGWVAPPLAYGSSGEHQSFAGTSSIGTDVLRSTVVELVRSMRTWSDRVVLVNGHGGNVTALTSAVDQLVDEGHAVTWVPCATELVDLHAGRTETSLMLHLAPWSVRRHLAEVGDTRPLAEILPLMRAGGVCAVSPNGVLGDPTGATATEGEEVLRAMVDDVLRRLVTTGVGAR
ncbi:creatinine amidohydrolase [Nocardioides alpinus]|uniref:Creatinine amidohydrolase n=1 Tax=Nocardioides alpinus TaxID=748909 RepID=A0A1I1AXV0_9ACTN|nr:mycofactocin biosynthesis peptidyl-dipeptidase MftE [Nocardioides alpinus]PKH40942.1 mycofactocin biosynthesis peptidyl-dipeptidase MftE [Nocardioides alpinus]SFB42236.1 creatinine amidohydrolase [Nocardioides alpinus]